MRTRTARCTLAAGRPWDLPVPEQEASAHARVCDLAGSSRRSRRRARPCCLPHSELCRHPGCRLSRFNGWPMLSPTDASPTSSRTPAHSSGPMWVATPSPWGTCTLHFLPVSPAHSETLHFFW